MKENKNTAGKKSTNNEKSAYIRLPEINSSSFKVPPAELGLILEGIDLTDRSRPRAI